MVLLDGWRSVTSLGKCKGFLGRRDAVSISEVFQFVTMLCAVAALFYRIGKDISKNRREKDNTKK